MIQRKQSIWLLIAALLNSGLLYFSLYNGHTIVNGVDTLISLRVVDHYPSLLVALVIIALPLVSIFMFKKRKQQRSMVVFSIVAVISFVATILMRVGTFNNQTPAPTNCSYGIGAVLPVLSIIFLVMAIRGINKDDKLVKSLDRLR